jgi:hypothetical protein
MIGFIVIHEESLTLYEEMRECLIIHTVTVHPQNVQLLDVQLQNVQLQNVH